MVYKLDTSGSDGSCGPSLAGQIETTLVRCNPRPRPVTSATTFLAVTQARAMGTQEELQTIQGRQVFPMGAAREELTNRPFSLAMDVGMYFLA